MLKMNSFLDNTLKMRFFTFIRNNGIFFDCLVYQDYLLWYPELILLI